MKMHHIENNHKTAEKSLSKEPWFPEEQIVEKILKGKISAHDPLVDNVFSRIIGGVFTMWFERQEQKIYGQALSRTHEIKKLGTEEAERVVMYLPGMFDYGMEERAQTIFKSGTDQRKEFWMAIKALYSLRDTKRIFELMGDLEALLEERIHVGKTVTIVGYSCGGLVGKVLADRLSTKYPGTCGLVVHNAPIDPTGGFFVRYANVAEFQEEIGFRKTHEGTYPLIVLNGSGDMIVPCTSCLQDESGGEIKTKGMPGTHRRSCAHPIAAKRIRAAIRAVEMHIPKFPRRTHELA
ncbi:hypothetical protein HY413_03725 [Candidatus Kaiserbacteria bacterium]|nr:hypothetical protein [Candidatus Kaiserbacteria bacterium]